MTIGAWGAHKEIRKAITVDISGTGDAATAVVAGRLAVDHKAAVACGDGGEVDGAIAGLAKNHIGSSAPVGIDSLLVEGISEIGAEDEIGKAVAIDITSPGDADATAIVG